MPTLHVMLLPSGYVTLPWHSQCVRKLTYSHSITQLVHASYQVMALSSPITWNQEYIIYSCWNRLKKHIFKITVLVLSTVALIIN